MKPVGLGIIGCGVIGTAHLKTATNSPIIELVAIADLIEEKRQKAAEEFNPKKAYSSGEELLNDEEVEAVVLAFPTRHRTEVALQAFFKDKHVLTEKPVAMNAEEVRKMIAARGELTAACCSSRYRFRKSADAITNFITAGGLGELRVVRCRAIGAAGERPDKPGPEWRLKKELNGGGILVNWGCYDMDYLLGITDWSLKPKKVFAQTWTIPSQFEAYIAPDSNAETYYLATVRCENGCVISLERGEFMPAQSEYDWQIIGEKGTLNLKMTEPNPKAIIHDDTDSEKGVISKTLLDEEEEDAGVIHSGPLTDFATAIRENRQPKTNLEQSLTIQQITDAVYASAEQGVAVEID